MVWITATTISWFWKQSKIIQRIYSTILLNVWFDCVSYLRHICHKCCYHQRHKCVVWNLYPNYEVTKNSNISPSWNCGTIFKLVITYLLLAPKIFENISEFPDNYILNIILLHQILIFHKNIHCVYIQT